MLPARPADACSPPLRPTLADAAAIIHGRTGVPTNLVILATPRLPDTAFESSVWLRRLGAEMPVRLDVSFDPDFTRLRPPEPLRPSTLYHVFGFNEPTLPELADGETLEDHAASVFEFQTGSGPDTQPPAPPTLLRVETREVWPDIPFLQALFACGPPETGGTAAWFTVEPEPASVVGYRLSRGDPPTAVDAELERGDDAVFLSDFVRDEGGFRPYRITAIDLAGNESEPVEQVMNLGCAGTCASGDPAPLGLVLGLLALRLRRRRR